MAKHNSFNRSSATRKTSSYHLTYHFITLPHLEWGLSRSANGWCFFSPWHWNRV